MATMLGRGVSKYAAEISYHYYIAGGDPLENELGKEIGKWNAQMKK